MELDKLDKNIIYILGEDARISYKELANRIDSKKEVVAYRINNLIKNKVITKFVPVFALSRVGIFSGKIYINLKGVQNDDKTVKWLIKNKEVSWVAESVGKWDLLIGFYYKNILEFARIKNRILSKLGNHIQDYEISFIEDGLVYNREYLIDKNKPTRKEFIYGGEASAVKIGSLDKKIISLIKNNGRFEYLDIANKLKIDARTVLARIKELKERGILQGFTVFIDLNKIGYKLHKICIYLNRPQVSSYDKVIDCLKENSEVIHLIKSIGSWELEVEIESNNIEEIYNFIKSLKSELPEIIKKIDLVTINKELKLDFFPDWMI